MDLVFNDLSARENGGDNTMGIRFGRQLHDVALVPETANSKPLSMAAWASKASHLEQNLLLAARRYPYLGDGMENEEEEYCRHTFTRNGEHCDGLSVAHLLDWPALSLAGNAAWRTNQIDIRKMRDDGDESRFVSVSNIYSEACSQTECMRASFVKHGDVRLRRTVVPASEKKSVCLSTTAKTLCSRLPNACAPALMLNQF